jgi:hypothetical protein
MSFILLHATVRDIEAVRTWLNDASEVAWIIKDGQSGDLHQWRAVKEIPQISQPEYALWHLPSGPLNIPSGKLGVPDTVVADPFAGWAQRLEGVRWAPWFGANLPGPFHFHFRPIGREATDAVGRSGFSWAMDRFKSIGKPADVSAKAFWQRLRRFVASSSIRQPWPDGSGRFSRHVFPEAEALQRAGHHLDINP